MVATERSQTAKRPMDVVKCSLAQIFKVYLGASGEWMGWISRPSWANKRIEWTQYEGQNITNHCLRHSLIQNNVLCAIWPSLVECANAPTCPRIAEFLATSTAQTPPISAATRRFRRACFLLIFWSRFRSVLTRFQLQLGLQLGFPNPCKSMRNPSQIHSFVPPVL